MASFVVETMVSVDADVDVLLVGKGGRCRRRRTGWRESETE